MDTIDELTAAINKHKAGAVTLSIGAANSMASVTLPGPNGNFASVHEYGTTLGEALDKLFANRPVEPVKIEVKPSTSLAGLL